MTPDEQKNNRKTATAKKINWHKVQKIAVNTFAMTASAFVTGVAMAAGQKLANQITFSSASPEKNGLSIVRDRTAV